MELLPFIGRIHFVGDAIGAADPMTGEGIAQALRTGKSSAQAIMQSGPFNPLQAGELYKKNIASQLGHDHRFARSLQTLLKNPESTEFALRLANSNAWTRRNFARWMFEDYPRALVLTPNRWSRNMFDYAGAYQQNSSTKKMPEEISSILTGGD
tara:strand:+ start:139 stop:600 length:462 start_codon:yes stop_codon:yes gene_type:complete